MNEDIYRTANKCQLQMSRQRGCEGLAAGAAGLEADGWGARSWLRGCAHCNPTGLSSSIRRPRGITAEEITGSVNHGNGEKAVGITGQVGTQSGGARSRRSAAVNTNSQHVSRQPQALLGVEAGLFIVPRQQNATQKGHASCLKHRRAGSGPVTGANSAFMIASGHSCSPCNNLAGFCPINVY